MCVQDPGVGGASTLSPSPAVALSRTRRLRAVEGAPRCCDLKLQELLDGTHAAGSLPVDAALLASTDPVAIPLFPGAETSVPHAPASAARDQAAVEEPDSKPQRINQLLCERLPLARVGCRRLAGEVAAAQPGFGNDRAMISFMISVVPA